MKNIIITLTAILSLNSCQSQNNVDLLQLKFGNNIENIVSKENYKKDREAVYGIQSFRTDKLKYLKIGNTTLQTYHYPNSGLAYYNVLYIFVDNLDNNNFLGFNYSTVNQEETRSIIDHLKKKYNTIDDRSDNYTEAYFIDIPEEDAWLFINQSIGNDFNKNKFFTTNFTYVKRSIRVENSTDPNYFTILESFNMGYPPKDNK